MPQLLQRVPASGELGRSVARCGTCGHSLAPQLAAPALPWLLAGGRCAGCGAARPRWCAGVEVATGLTFGLAAARAGWSATLLPVLSLFAGLVAMSVVDIWAMRIPTRFARVTTLAVGLTIVVATAVDGGIDADTLRGALVGAGVLGGGLLVLHLISPRMLGFGDVRLATVAGLVVGWLAWTPEHPVLGPVEGALDAALLGGFIGALVGVALLVMRRRNDPFAFGPSLAVGAAVVILASL
ncbi:MAG TPA: A24 family peptidase [Acidimicrobiales bacterium]|nr:A24 family peptidase [Acidimicrobiales bacterium]